VTNQQQLRHDAIRDLLKLCCRAADAESDAAGVKERIALANMLSEIWPGPAGVKDSEPKQD
jgi:hypothetical protein